MFFSLKRKRRGFWERKCLGKERERKIILYFVIPMRLPGLNDYISALDHNRYAGGNLKKRTEADIYSAIMIAVSKGMLRPVGDSEYPIRVNFEWHEKTKKRDLDNIASAKKYILDAMQTAEIIKGDGQKYVGDLNDIFCMPSDEDKVIVYIERIGEE